MKKHISVMACMIILAFAMFTLPAKAAKIPVIKNGTSTTLKGTIVNVKYGSKKVSTSSNSTVAPSIKMGSTIYVPLKTMFSENGIYANYSENSNKTKATLTYGKRKVTFYAKKKYATVNGTKMNLKVSPYFVTFKSSKVNDMLVPAKQAAAFLGLKYSYSGSTKTVTLKVRQGIDDSATRTKTVSQSEFLKTIGPIARGNYQRTGVLASVTIAQAILESGWGQSKLAENGNNLFGMKMNLSGNSWSDSSWDGVNYCTKGVKYRKYSCMEDSIEDHSAYLLNAKNGSHKRYAGLSNTKSYKKQLQIIQRGGYCTTGGYVSYLSRIISRYNLTKWDKK